MRTKLTQSSAGQRVIKAAFEQARKTGSDCNWTAIVTDEIAAQLGLSPEFVVRVLDDVFHDAIHQEIDAEEKIDAD